MKVHSDTINLISEIYDEVCTLSRAEYEDLTKDCDFVSFDYMKGSFVNVIGFLEIMEDEE